MPELIEIQCPHCKSSLKLKSRDPLGKKVQCPKCTQPFVAKERRRAPQPVEDYEDYEPAPAPAPQPKRRPKPQDELDDFDDFGDTAGIDDDFDSPPRKSAGGGRKKKPVKKKKSSGGWVKWVLIGGGGAAGVALLVLGVWLGVRMFGSKKLDLAWLPDDANTISVSRIGELWKSELVKNGMDSQVKDAASKMKDDWGFGPQDIVSVTNAQSPGRTLKVLRTTVDLDEDKILKHAGEYEKTTVGGKTAYRLSGGMMVFFPDKRTAISGTENAVTKAIDQGPKPIKRDDLKFVDGGYHIVSVHLVSDSGVKVSGEIFGMDLGKVRGNFSGVSITSSIKSVHVTKFASAADAADAMEKAEKLRKEFEERFKNIARDSKWKEAKEDAEKHVSGSHSGPKRSGDTIRVSSTLKPISDKARKFLGQQGVSAVSIIAQNPASLFSMPFRVNFGNQNPFQPNVGRNVGRFRRNPNVGFGQPARGNVKIYDVTVDRYRGNRDQAFEARAALKTINGLDDSRTNINGNRITLYSRPNQNVDNQIIAQKLQQAGFGSVTVNQFRNE